MSKFLVLLLVGNESIFQDLKSLIFILLNKPMSRALCRLMSTVTIALVKGPKLIGLSKK